jgi:hypothetical protein
MYRAHVIVYDEMLAPNIYPIGPERKKRDQAEVDATDYAYIEWKKNRIQVNAGAKILKQSVVVYKTDTNECVWSRAVEVQDV